jgi:hypothetical protein
LRYPQGEVPPPQRSPQIDLPLKITLTPQGVEWFMRNRRRLSQLRMADSRLEYGITVSNFPASALQQMINIDYITSIELARTEFSSKRREIIDLTKLISFRLLYRKFENESYRRFLNSGLIKRWNRANPTRVLDKDTVFNQATLESFLSAVAADIPAVSRLLQQPIVARVAADASLGTEERRLRAFLIDAFVLSMRKIIWYVLVRTRGQSEYVELVREFQQLLAEYVDKALIAEYLALMVIEITSHTELAHYRQVAAGLYDNPRAAGEVASNERLRATVRRQMERDGDYLFLTYQLGSKGASIGTEHRLRITVANQEKEFARVRDQLDKKPQPSAREKSLADFYRLAPNDSVGTELGRYYLSFLQSACEKQNVHIESIVSQPARSDLTVIRLSLQF